MLSASSYKLRGKARTESSVNPSSGPDHFVEMNETEFLREAIKVVEGAHSKGTTLRLLGALAVYAKSADKPECVEMFKRLGRFGDHARLFTDLDLAGYGKQRKEIAKFLEGMNFRPAPMVNVLFGNRRLVYYHPKNSFQVDIFLDKLEFSHDVDFGQKPGSGRLELDYPTISLADIVLEKLQIHRINRKDLVDLAVLFAGHETDSTQSKGKIDGGYVAGVLSGDWEFWYDAVNNLNQVKSFASEQAASRKLSSSYLGVVTGRVDKMLSMIEATPKSKDWLKRSKAGTNKRWYREVEEVSR